MKRRNSLRLLAAMSFVVLLVLAGSRSKPLEGLVTPDMTRDLGNMLLTLTMFWGYLTLSQYLIVWSGNLPDEVRYFAVRLHGGWNWIGTLLVVGQFFIPFLLLLSTALKRSARMLGFVCAWILAMRVIGILWTLAPAFPDQASHSVGLDLVLIVAMGIVWLGWFAAMRRRAAPVPAYDPRLREATGHA